jgi:nucleoid-associated protein YgaU
MGRRDLPREAVGEQTEISPATEILEGEGLSMGKEVKIGLGVIVVLLVVFGGVLYYRLSGPPADVAAAAETKPTEPAGEVVVASDQADSATTPTVVTATAGSDSDKSTLSVSDMAKWNSKSTGQRPANRSADASSQSRVASTPPSYMPQTGAKGHQEHKSHLSDPFHRQTAKIEVGGGDASGAAVPPAPSPTVVAYGDSASSTSRGQAGEAEAAVASSHNPLRSLSPGGAAGTTSVPPAPFVRDSYGYPASNSSLQVATNPSAASGANPPRPMHGHDFDAGQGYRSAQESPAYGSQYNVPATRAGMNQGRATHGTGAIYGAGDSYGGNASYDDAPQGARNSAGVNSRRSPTSPSAANNTGKYIIQPNDSYWTISEQIYGTGAYFQALAEHNRKKFPDENRLKAGEEIVTPALAELEKSYPKLCPKPEHRDATKRQMSVVSSPVRHGGGRVYVVQEGDTLFDIARYELGKAARWAEIYELNREAIGTDFDHLNPGMQLLLPRDPSPGKVTQRSEDRFQR